MVVPPRALLSYSNCGRARLFHRARVTRVGFSKEGTPDIWRVQLESGKVTRHGDDAPVRPGVDRLDLLDAASARLPGRERDHDGREADRGNQVSPGIQIGN